MVLQWAADMPVYVCMHAYSQFEPKALCTQSCGHAGVLQTVHVTIGSFHMDIFDPPNTKWIYVYTLFYLYGCKKHILCIQSSSLYISDVNPMRLMTSILCLSEHIILFIHWH
jgi:hypothetical protein